MHGLSLFSPPLLYSIFLHAAACEIFFKCRSDNLSKILLFAYHFTILPGSVTPSLTLNCVCLILELLWDSSNCLAVSRSSVPAHAVPLSRKTSVHCSFVRLTGISKPSSWMFSLKALDLIKESLFSFPQPLWYCLPH